MANGISYLLCPQTLKRSPAYTELRSLCVDILSTSSSDTEQSYQMGSIFIVRSPAYRATLGYSPTQKGTMPHTGLTHAQISLR